MPENVRTDVPDSRRGRGPLHLLFRPRVAVGQSAEIDRARKDPIVRPPELASLFPRFEAGKQLRRENERLFGPLSLSVVYHLLNDAPPNAQP